MESVSYPGIVVDGHRTVVELLAERDHVLLDFDGPVCGIFGGPVNDHDVADRLKQLLGDVLPADIANTHDPFDVLGYSASCGPATAKVVDTQLSRLEGEAVVSAPEAPGAADALRSLHGAGFTITIVSNNAVTAVRTFLVLHNLTSCVRRISARDYTDPALLNQALSWCNRPSAR